MYRRMLVALVLAFVLAFAISLPANPRAYQSKPVDVMCTFTNPSYAGECVEKTTRTEKQKPAAACAPILDCLNNERCVKTYCQSTTLRQGWKLKKAE